MKKVAFPLQPGSVSIPVDVSTSALIPASLAKVDVHITAEDQKGESVVCLDVHTVSNLSLFEISFYISNDILL